MSSLGFRGAASLAEIAKREPESQRSLIQMRYERSSRLKALGDKKDSGILAEVLPKVRRASRLEGYKNGL